jgi:type II secretory pathway pseudopilin PulG
MSHRDSGFSFVDLTLVVAILAMVAGIVIPAYSSRTRESRTTALAADATRFYDALVRFKEETGNFPATFAPSERALDRTTLAPLSSEGYLDNAPALVEQLQAYRVSIYFSPTIDGANEKFWSILAHDDDPSILLLVAHTDSFTMDPGDWYDGVYFIIGDEIVPVTEIRA